MPTLIPAIWTVIRPVVPYVWSCSECDAAFDMGPMRGLLPSQDQIDQINLQFEAHCKQVHPRSLHINCLGHAANPQAILGTLPERVELEVHL
jgi:hypothetical protein